MKWSIPAKTFLLGEYAALLGGPAIVLTTLPCFEVALSNKPGLQGIHPDSPAGRWWIQQGYDQQGIQWDDPYQGCGGLGASSAQFLGVYWASMYLQKSPVNQEDMLDAYLQCAWQGQGLPPSGYDVLAQSLQGCVYIHKQQKHCEVLKWPFDDLAFLLLHTGKKLATHQHLQTIELPDQINPLVEIVASAKTAFARADSQGLIDAVNAYHQQLAQLNWVGDHSLQHIDFFKQHPDVLAVKGCGAMGADVLLLLVAKNRQSKMSKHLSEMGWRILATSESLA